jgi:hypothetical protein
MRLSSEGIGGSGANGGSSSLPLSGRAVAETTAAMPAMTSSLEVRRRGLGACGGGCPAACCLHGMPLVSQQLRPSLCMA